MVYCYPGTILLITTGLKPRLGVDGLTKAHEIAVFGLLLCSDLLHVCAKCERCLYISQSRSQILRSP